MQLNRRLIKAISLNNVPFLFLFLIFLFSLPTYGQQISSFTLIDATADEDIKTLTNGEEIILENLPTNELNVRANLSTAVGSVVFYLNGKKHRTENVEPYALFGDKNEDYFTWTPDIGLYKITATAYTGSGGKGQVVDSNEISFSFIESSAEPSLPAAPSDISGIALKAGEVELSWSDNSDNETLFELEYREGQGAPWMTLTSIPANSTSFTHMLNNGSGYASYRIRSVNDVGPSSFSNITEVTEVPYPPTALTASDITETSFTLSWQEAPFGNDYLIEVSPTISGSWSFWDALYYGYTDFTYSNLEPGTTYFLRMRTNFQGKSSQWSEIISITTQDDAPNEGPLVTKFFLVNADSDQDITLINEEDTFNLFDIGTTNLNIRAEVTNGTESVVFGYNENDNFRTENVPVYALAGNSGSNYYNWTPALGLNSVTATAYTLNKGKGIAGPSSIVNFVVINEDTSDPVDPVDPDPNDPGVDLGVSGELRKWHKITVTFEGPELSESMGENPFKDYRLNVTFTNDTTTYVVPGYYAADGNAENTGATSGKIWKAHFSPNKTGTWTYTASFKKGNNVAVSFDESEGTPVSFDGASGQFTVMESDKTGVDFRGKGRLSYVGEHYLQFEGSGDYFLKAGADAPENTLAYEDLDATPNKGGRRKSWQPHAGDFSLGDAASFTWGADQGDGARAKGREMLGMLKYLSDEGMNVFSFLTFSLNGDDGNVYPHVQKTSDATDWNNVEHTRFDVSKLAQWERIFQYAQKRGIYLHFKTQETENDQRMDGGQLGVERMLYYRELIARFSHHLALNWNLGEENDIWQELNDPSGSIVKAYAQFIKNLDPYDHHIVIHTYPGQQDEVYDQLTGSQSQLTGPSVQSGINNIHNDVRRWVVDSRTAGKKWVVANDEQGGANSGVSVDAAYPDGLLPEPRNVADNRKNVRHKVLWGTLMAGGAGVEYYYGYQTGCDDLDCEDHRTRQTKWNDARFALEFFNSHLQPYLDQMESNDQLTSITVDYVFAQPGQVYAIYLPSGGSTNINLGSGNEQYTVKWYNPRSGGSLVDGSVTMLDASQSANIGTPPNSTSSDWVALLKRSGTGGSMPVQPTNLKTDDIRFSLYPNPALDRFTVEMNEGAGNEQYSLRILNSNGQVVKEQKLAKGTSEVSISDLSPGNYFVIATCREFVKQRQLIVIR